ncbi:hypothetical protein EC973_002841 [Apophysomyces ossiformis]|uniref:DUF866-domain-containing protein n=1 Tax=Apophysomyces ossiformis TaxID=679940 RepID=A0A8H7BHV7_9FUNG|nr:hypothetical protein EC973_002841 [Apophysomyces ossiformis]
MVKLGLYFKADLENVTDLLPAADYEWHFKIQCASCRETDSSWISFNRQDEYEMTHSKGTANLVMKCKFCKRESSALFETNAPIHAYNNSGKFQKIATFDCRGLELVDFSPRDPWSAKGTETATPFEDIDLLELEWADYDEKAGEPVGISNIEVEFRKEK